MKSINSIEQALLDLVQKKYVGFVPQVKIVLLSAISSLRGDPTKKVNLFLFGPSGSGKTALLDSVGRLFPNYKLIVYSSAKWTHYAQNEIKNDSLYCFDESSNLSNETYGLLRGQTNLDSQDGIYGTVTEGFSNTLSVSTKFTAWMNAVSILSDTQLMDRFLKLGLEPSSEQRLQIRKHKKQELSEEELQEAHKLTEWITELKPKVIVDFYVCTDDSVGNREYLLLMNLFEAYVILQNPNSAIIEATVEEFNEFYVLLESSGLLEAGGLSKEQEVLVCLLEEAEMQLTIANLLEGAKERGICITYSTCRRLLDELDEYISEDPLRGAHGVKRYFLAKPVRKKTRLWVDNDAKSE